MKYSSTFFVSVSVAMMLLGAGCAGSSPAPAAISPTTGSSAPTATAPAYGGGSTASVPSDIPTYPGGFVLAVTGSGAQIAVAQSTPDGATQVIEWVRSAEAHLGNAYQSTSVEGSSTNLVFTNATYRYHVRIDSPRGGGGAYLTVAREANLPVAGS